ncbi:MAG: GWxTD domain-containing protein [Ignavibacteriales bacterium]|nr:GWxTD domain-containing protein [Ignavibacteriales bacterium]
MMAAARTYRLLMLLVFPMLPAMAQVENEQESPRIAAPLFFLDALSFWGNDSLTRLDVFVQVPHTELHYVSDVKGFEAKYEVTANVLDADGRSVQERIWYETVQAADFDATVNKKMMSTTQRSLLLKAGKYSLRVQVHDVESKNTAVLVRELTLDNYAAHVLSVSDIMLANAAILTGGRATISPNISGNMIEADSGFFVFYEIYADRSADSVTCIYRIFSRDDNCIYRKAETRAYTGKKMQIIARIDSVQFPIGTYNLQIDVSLPGNPSVAKRRGLIFQWSDIPVTIADLDLAIRQLRYIASEEEVKDFGKATTYDEKQKLFSAFWRKRDPSPDSKRNEFMEEYYGRVEYADIHFKHYLEGWRTDMGMVYIIFGAPNNVDRHPFDYDAKPYEVWSYYDYNAQLVFVDGTGFGDYRLITPIWDMLHRLKNR